MDKTHQYTVPTNLTKDELNAKKRLERMDKIKINKHIDLARLPRHVAFIMDGNGRWANHRGMPRSYGHSVGYEKMIMTVMRCAKIGIPVVSVFAFSTENWKRPKEEIDGVFNLVRKNMKIDVNELNKAGIRVDVMGDISAFPKDLQDKFAEIHEATCNNKRCIFVICANYGGRADIMQAVNKLAAQTSESKQRRDKQITEQVFSSLLQGADYPDPDLVVRTSGEQRVSNFMLWQMAYSEFLFIKQHWPAMTPQLVDECIVEFQKRKRRFGKTV